MTVIDALRVRVEPFDDGWDIVGAVTGHAVATGFRSLTEAESWARRRGWQVVA